MEGVKIITGQTGAMINPLGAPERSGLQIPKYTTIVLRPVGPQEFQVFHKSLVRIQLGTMSS